MGQDNLFEKIEHVIEDSVASVVRRVSGFKGKGKGTEDKGSAAAVKSANTGLSSVVVAEATEAPADNCSVKSSPVNVGSGSGSGSESNPPAPKATDVLEVWFSGCHTG